MLKITSLKRFFRFIAIMGLFLMGYTYPLRVNLDEVPEVYEV
jgi:hypothetical protein